MYHVELRQFPHNFCHFNLTEEELRAAVLDAWAQGDWLELGERKWNPHQAHLTVIEGPRLALGQLSMGRGWRTAVREGQDVTERMLAAARAATSAARQAGGTDGDGVSARAPDASEAGLEPVVASVVGELAGRLGQDSGALLRGWQLALERHPDRSPSECLALAENLLRG